MKLNLLIGPIDPGTWLAFEMTIQRLRCKNMQEKVFFLTTTAILISLALKPFKTHHIDQKIIRTYNKTLKLFFFMIWNQ